ncbi:MAG: glycosyltransferase family 2 protein [Bacteroidaceae bacterium]|nr:glycosyltransferase family 2 protein [Bacteroidaceae bacterium]
MQPLVSVITITYNHAPYIAKCIEGVLMQKVDFPMEFIIADDCSTDGTREICEKYAKKNPNLIRLILTEKNVGAVENEQRAFKAAKGKYIATCEGDDYWTSSFKLQKQVDFLEANPDYSVCFHRFHKYDSESGIWQGDFCENLFKDSNTDGVEISMHQFMHQWVTQYLTMVFRKNSYDFAAYSRYKYFRDTHQIYHLIRNGRCWLFAFNGGVYHLTGSGMYSFRTALKREQMTLMVDKELWRVNGDEGWKEMCSIVMQDIVDNFASQKKNLWLLLRYSTLVFLYTGRFKKYIKNILLVL